MVTLEGILLRSDLEGGHFELRVARGPYYVVVPAADEVRQVLVTGVGRRLRVRGYLHEGPNIFMRGPVLRALEAEFCSVNS